MMVIKFDPFNYRMDHGYPQLIIAFFQLDKGTLLASGTVCRVGRCLRIHGSNTNCQVKLRSK